jgi:hypothetical protein
MAVSIAVRKRSVRGNEQAVYVDITGPASYTTGGESLSAADLVKLVGKPGALIGDIVQFDAETPTTGQSLALDRTNSKVMYFNGTTQITAAVNLSAVVARAVITSVVNG